MLAQVGPNLGPRSAPGASRRVSQCVPRGSWEGPGGSRSSKGSQGRSRDQFRLDFWSIFDDFGTYFGTYFWSFFIFLGVNFWSFWSQVLLITWLKGSELTVKCLGFRVKVGNPRHFTLNPEPFNQLMNKTWLQNDQKVTPKKIKNDQKYVPK